MAVLTTYKGLEVVESATGAGGAALTSDFKELADRAPMKSEGVPDATDDANAGYYPGSLWFDVLTETMWICVDATVGSAIWRSFYARSDTGLTLIPEESAQAVVVRGKLGVGIAAPKAGLHAADSTIVGAGGAAVADADLDANQVNLWLDETAGTEKLMFKVKLGNGMVKSGEIPLT